MNKEKIFKIFLLVSLSLMLTFSLAGCGESEEESYDGPSTEEEVREEIEEGVQEFEEKFEEEFGQ